VERALAGVLGRPGFSVVHFSVQTNHVHLLVEARDTCALARGMQALAIRLALALNRHLGRKGPVLSDRYHARALRTPREVRNALSYVLNNFRRHVAASWRRDGSVVNPYWLDPCSSARAFDGWRGEAEPPEPGARPPPISPAATWLFTVGWRRHGLVRVDETPPSAWA
jgi:REP element-mobilizing transposase RayT